MSAANPSRCSGKEARIRSLTQASTIPAKKFEPEPDPNAPISVATGMITGAAQPRLKSDRASQSAACLGS